MEIMCFQSGSSSWISFRWFIIGFFVLSDMHIMGQSLIQPLDGSSLLYTENNEVDGSPYIFSDFVYGHLKDTEGNSISDVLINYNAELEVMVAKQGEKKYLQLNKYLYKSVKTEKELYKNLTEIGISGFGREIYGGKNIQFYEKTIANKSRADRNNYNEIKALYKIRKSNHYYLVIKGEVHEIKRKEKSLYEFFPRNELKTFVKQNNIKIKQDDHLVKLLEHYDK